MISGQIAPDRAVADALLATQAYILSPTSLTQGLVTSTLRLPRANTRALDAEDAIGLTHP